MCGTRKEEPAQGVDLRRKAPPLPQAGGGRKIVGAVWTLHPSPEFVEENIRSNEQMAEKKQLGRVMGFQDPGEIRAAFARERFLASLGPGK